MRSRNRHGRDPRRNRPGEGKFRGTGRGRKEMTADVIENDQVRKGGIPCRSRPAAISRHEKTRTSGGQMKYKVGVVKKITFLLMTMALAIALVACPGAAGAPGEPGKAGEAGQPGGVPPTLETEFSAHILTDSGEGATVTINLDDHFWDPDDETAELTYVPSSSDEAVVTAAVSGRSTLTLTAVAAGMAKITVTATDKDDLSSRGRFDVTVVETGAPIPTQIPSQTLYKDDGEQTIDLSMYFTHERAITYTASALPEGIVTVSVSGGTLTLTPVVTGQARVTVTATADSKNATNMFTVDVMAGSAPVPPVPPQPDMPEAKGMIDDVTVEVDDTEMVDASMYFTPDTGLTFSVSDDDDDIATATVDASGMVTITGVAEGDATITVTATNSAGSAMQEIEVMVRPAGPPHVDDLDGMLEIDGVGEEESVRIGAGQSLRSLQPTKVSFTNEGQIWTITALEKGMATVRVLNSDNTVDMTFEVKINNTPPGLKDDAAAEAITSVVLAAEADPVDKGGATPRTAPSATAAGERQYYKVNIDFSALFTDADGDSDIKDYVAESQEQYVSVVTAVHSGAATTWGVILDAEMATGYSFPIEVYAVDDAGDMSDPVQLQIGALEPQSDGYRITQNAIDGAFQPLEVWRRKGVANDLFFLDYVGAGSMGFNFVKAFEQDLIADDLWFSFGPTHASTVLVEAPATVPDADDAGAVPYFTVATGGAVNAATLAFPSDDATGTFTLKGDGSSGTITYTLHVVVCTGAGGPPVDSCATGDALVVQEWRSVSKTLTLNIVDSSEGHDS